MYKRVLAGSLVFGAVFVGYHQQEKASESPDVAQHAAPPVSSPAVPMMVGVDGADAVAQPVSGDWLNHAVRDLFDYYASLYEQGEAVMWQQFNRYCQALAHCDPLTELFTRYLAYKQQLAAYDNDYGDSLTDIRLHLDRVQTLQAEYFSAAEQQALFAEHNAWDAEALARMAIQRDDTLNPEQKAQLMDEHIDALPETMRQAFVPTRTLRKVNRWMQSADEGDSYTFNQLSAEVGAEAATRLMTVKAEQQAWQARVAAYRERLQVLKSRYPTGSVGYAEQQQALMDDLFDANEQKRLRVVLPFTG